MYNNKNITGKTKIIDPNKDRVWIFWKCAPFINIKLRPLCDRQRSYFWKVKSLKKKNCHSGLRRFILDSGKKKNKNKNKCRSLKAIKNIAWNSPSKLNLFPLVKARFSGKWFVLCSLKYRVNYAETRHWFVELSNTIIERTAILFLQCGRFVCVGLSWKHERKKKITISKKNTLKESLQEDCCGNRFCVKECHSCTLRERKTSVSFRSFRLIGGTKTLKSIKFVYWL